MLLKLIKRLRRYAPACQPNLSQRDLISHFVLTRRTETQMFFVNIKAKQTNIFKLSNKISIQHRHFHKLFDIHKYLKVLTMLIVLLHNKLRHNNLPYKKCVSKVIEKNQRTCKQYGR